MEKKSNKKLELKKVLMYGKIIAKKSEKDVLLKRQIKKRSNY